MKFSQKENFNLLSNATLQKIVSWFLFQKYVMLKTLKLNNGIESPHNSL